MAEPANQKFPTDEFIQFIRDRFPGASIKHEKNNCGTDWIDVSTESGHASIVATGTIGATDVAHLRDDIQPFAPYDHQVYSVQEAKDFVVRALIHVPSPPKQRSPWWKFW